MNRQEKELLVKDLKKGFLDSKATFLVDFKGLSVAQMQALRVGLRDKGSFLRVAKNRLMKRAIDGESGFDQLAPFFREQIGVVFVEENFSDVAKMLSDFSKENEALGLVAGYLESTVVDKSGISQIALLPSREVLLACVCRALNAPISGLAVSLNMIVLKLLFALKQVGEQKK